jgi:hypothetical protein
LGVPGGTSDRGDRPEDPFNSVWEDGGLMTVDEVVNQALERLHETTDGRDRAW